MGEKIRLNLGCGQRKLPGYLNVDAAAACAPDLVLDLESFPWPWEDDSVGQVLLIHVLEHLGQAPATFLGIMRELWRVCCDGAEIVIEVPHPRSDEFLGDPTHVRPITPGGLSLFSQRFNRECERLGAANTPLGVYLGVDFELVRSELVPKENWLRKLQRGEIDEAGLREAGESQWNVYSDYRATLRVIKPAGGGAAGRDAGHLRERVEASLARGDHAGALADLRELCAMNPEDVESRYRLAMCLHVSGDLAAACEQYRQLFEAGVQTYELLVNFGVTNQELGNLDLAVLCYEAALESSPGDRLARCNLAEAKGLAGDLPLSLALFEALRAEDAGDVAVPVSIARVLLAHRMVDDARQVLDSVRRDVGTTPEIEALAREIEAARTTLT